MAKRDEIRCSKCGKKLAEHAIVEGAVSILCLYNAGKGTGPCRTLNVVTVSRKKNNKITNDAI